MKTEKKHPDIGEMKNKVIKLMGNHLDETSINGMDSFVEMNGPLIHLATTNRDYYFRVTLTTCPEFVYDRGW